jgi:hypothetical protein
MTPFKQQREVARHHHPHARPAFALSWDMTPLFSRERRSFLRKVTTAFHFHVENRVEIDILQAAAECAKSLQKMSGWSSIQSDGIWNSEKVVEIFQQNCRK